MKKYFLFLFAVFYFSHSYAQEARMVIPTGHSENIEAIDISADGKLVATGGRDNLVIIWDARTWRQLRTINVRTPVSQVLFSREADFLIIVESDEKMGMAQMNFSVWNVQDGRPINDLPFKGRPVCALSPDGKLLTVPNYFDNAAGSNGTTMAVWDFSKNKKIEIPHGSFDLPDDQFITYKDTYYLMTHGMNMNFTAGKIDNSMGRFKVELWDTRNFSNLTPDNNQNGKAVILAKSFFSNNQISQTAASPAGGLFATEGRGDIALWNIEQASPVCEYKLLGKTVRQMSFSGDGRKLFVYSMSKEENYVNIWDITDSSKDISFILPRNISSAMTKFSARGGYFITADKNTANVFDMQGNPLAKLSGHSVSFRRYVFSANGRFINTNTKIRAAVIRDNVTRNEVFTNIAKTMADLTEQQKGIKFTKAQRDSITAVVLKTSASKANTQAAENVRVWDLQYGTASSYVPDTISFTPDSVSPDKKYLLTAEYKPTALPSVKDMWSGAVDSTGKPAPIVVDTSSFFYKLFNSKESSFNRRNTDVTLLINTRTKDTVYLIALDSTDWIITAADGYYMASKNGAALLHYTINNDVISFEQLDLKNNRPDKILEKIGYADKNLIEAYRKAYGKRIEKFGIDTSYFHDRLTVPQADIVNKNDIGYLQKDEKLSLHIKGADGKGKLKKFNVWVNGVPVYGMKGIDIGWRNKNDFDTTVIITLSQGDNRIETSVLNLAGIESYRSPIFMKYSPLQASKEKVYFAGIGINQFEDTTYNLQYCRKDIRDLCLKLKENMVKGWSLILFSMKT